MDKHRLQCDELERDGLDRSGGRRRRRREGEACGRHGSVDEEYYLDEDLLDLEYHLQYVVNAQKRTRLFDTHWDSLIQAVSVLDPVLRPFGTDVFVVPSSGSREGLPPDPACLSCPSTKLHALTSRSICLTQLSDTTLRPSRTRLTERIGTSESASLADNRCYYSRPYGVVTKVGVA